MFERLQINALFRKLVKRGMAERICPDSANHDDRKACGILDGSNSLIGTLATGSRGKICS